MLKRLALLILLLPAALQAQSWSGILDSSRAYDWTTAGVVVPARATIYKTEATNVSITTLNTDLAACPANQAIVLPAATYTFASGITHSTNNCTLRGAGANQTKIVFTGGTNFNGLGNGGVGMIGSNSGQISPENSATWTAGFTKGATTITLSNTLNITAGSTLITIDQLDESADTGTIWNCLVTNVCSNGGSGGGARGGNRSQQQTVLVTACSTCNSATSQTVTISPGLAMPNWALAQTPGAFWATTTVSGIGLEDMSIDYTSLASNYAGVLMMNCYGCWVKGVRSLSAGRNHVMMFECSHCVVRDSYFYENQNHGSTSYGVELYTASDSLVENNIFDLTTDSNPSNTAGGVGNVAAYNYTAHTLYTNTPGWMQGGDYEHASGNSFFLREGNQSTGFVSDNVHGTHYFTTLNRNLFTGYQADCSSSPCVYQTDPIQMYAGSRYFNLIGNVLGAVPYQGYTLRQSKNANNQNFNTEDGIQTAASAATVGYFSPPGFQGHVLLSGMAFKPGTIPAYVNSASACDMFNSAATLGVTITGVTAGNLLAIDTFWSSSSATVTVADGDGAYTVVAGSKITDGSAYSLQGAYRPNAASGSHTITATYSAAQTNKCITVHEISGTAASPLDGDGTSGHGTIGLDAGAVSAGSHSISTGSWTTLTAGDYLMISGIDTAFSGGGAWLAGTAAFQDNYASTPTAGTKGNSSIYVMGWTGNGGTNGGTGQFCINAACGSKVDYDTLTTTYSMRWGNYDVVNGTTAFTSGEVPSGIAAYSNAVPASQSMPASFYLAAQPTWWTTAYGTPAYPAVGPDVTGGNISGYGGYANKIPSRVCYDNLSVDGGNPYFAFNATTCYTGPAAASTGAARTRVHR